MARKLKKNNGIQNGEPEKEEELPKYKSIVPLNKEQEDLIKVIHRNDIIFIWGVSGSGKTYISCGIAAEYLRRNLVDKLIITRPQISSESSGFLPGTAEEKISPYLTPLISELSYFINFKKELNDGRIVILPVAYCRGVTFKNSFVICDEFQNMNFRQLKMMLTRFGADSKLIFCGDTTQSDLDGTTNKECVNVVNRMSKLIADPENRIAVIELKTSVRHPIIEKILQVLE